MNESDLKTPRETRGISSPPKEKKSKGKKATHPIAAMSGIFKDDPLWDEFVEAMRRARIEEDAKEDVSR